MTFALSLSLALSLLLMTPRPCMKDVQTSELMSATNVLEATPTLLAVVRLVWTHLAGPQLMGTIVQARKTDGCSDALYDVLSSSQACCKCGGGHRAATPFTYYVAPVALHSFEVDGFPVP